MLTITLKKTLSIAIFCFATANFNSAIAKSDMQLMGDVQKARELSRQKDHSKHVMPKELSESERFRGVYYGYLPCKHCAGIKMTLSLKNKRNYLLVTQYAQASNREFFEKGKYNWDDKSRTVTLTSRKDSNTRILHIKDEGSLVVLSPEGNKMKGDQDQYTLVRSDKNKARAVHIH